MTSDLSIFATRLREFIGICTDELGQDSGLYDRSWSQHADAEFNAMALVLFVLQFTHNGPYRKFCEARNVHPNEVTHWKQIPAIPTSAFKELELTSLQPERRTHVFNSSGTTEQKPSRHFHNAESLAIYEASLWPWFTRHIVPDLRFTIYDLRLLTPPPAQAPHSSLIHMFETVQRKRGGASVPASRSEFLGLVTDDGSWTLDLDATLDALNSTLNTQHSTLLLGTAFSFVHLLDFLTEQNLCFKLPTGSRVMETGGYKGRSRSLPKMELHALITQRLGIPSSHIICEYGMSELSSQAYDHALSPSDDSSFVIRHFHFPPWSRAQIVSPETGREVANGETGLIRVFDLANVFSVMAIQTEDLGIRRSNGFELLGRTADVEPRGCSLMTV